MWSYNVKDRLKNEQSQDVRECKECCEYCNVNDTCDNTCIFIDIKGCKECKEWRGK